MIWAIGGLIFLIVGGALGVLAACLMAAADEDRDPRPAAPVSGGLVRLCRVLRVHDSAQPEGYSDRLETIWVNPGRVSVVGSTRDGRTVLYLAGKLGEVCVVESLDEVAAAIGVRVTPGAAGRPAGRIRLAGESRLSASDVADILRRERDGGES